MGGVTYTPMKFTCPGFSSVKDSVIKVGIVAVFVALVYVLFKNETLKNCCANLLGGGSSASGIKKPQKN
jgi:hypothetical protein